MVERDLDDLWAVAFKLRDVLVLLESQLSGKDGGVAITASQGAPAVPANPAEGTNVVPSPPTGGGFFHPDDGVPLRYGDVLDNGRGGISYFAGPCYVCGKVALTRYRPGAGKEGQHRCWSCFKAAQR